MAQWLKMTKSTRLGLMIGMVAAYFFAELTVGHAFGSATLTADSFHMLSDFVALTLALYANSLNKRARDAEHTFGYQRATVVGPLVNMVMLVTLCFTIVVEALAKFYEPTRMHKPEIVFYVGLGGLVINLVGILLFHGHSHGHSHGGNQGHGHGGNQGHGHGGNQGRGHGHENLGQPEPEVTGNHQAMAVASASELPPSGLRMEAGDTSNDDPSNAATSDHMNMHAAFLHILSDTLGSLIVILSALILWKIPDDAASPGGGGVVVQCSRGQSVGNATTAPGNCSCVSGKSHPWQAYLDPALSIVMVAIMLQATVPTLRQTLNILMHTVPKQVSLEELNNNLRQLQGIEETHDLHVWPLQPDCLIGTVHIRCKSLPEYIEVAKAAKNIFHNFNIHCTTIQLEFGNEAPDSRVAEDQKAAECSISCGPSGRCRRRNICCARGASKKSPTSSAPALTAYAHAGADN